MHDVAVIGGGPAGCAAAIACAQRGLSVVVIDPAAGDGARPGETLHPGAGVIFETLGVSREVDEAGLLRHAGQWIDDGGAPRFHQFGRDGGGAWLGYQARAEVLDPILLRRALACGAELRRETVEQPLVSGGRVAGVVTANGEHPARVVIDASGRRQWLATALALPLDIRSPRLIALYGYLCSDTLDDPTAPVLRLRDDGWSWIAPLGAGRAAWVRLVRADGVDRARAGAPALDCAARAADVTWRLVRPAAGPGYFLCGDAAFVLDPASSHGVLKALVSGAMAASCAADIVHRRAGASAVADAYARWMTETFDHDHAKLSALYERFGVVI